MMSAGSKFEYLWREEKKKKPIKACSVERGGEEGGGPPSGPEMGKMVRCLRDSLVFQEGGWEVTEVFYFTPNHSPSFAKWSQDRPCGSVWDRTQTSVSGASHRKRLATKFCQKMPKIAFCVKLEAYILGSFWPCHGLDP